MLEFGSGARALGMEPAIADAGLRAFVLIGSPLWDRVQGLPFCNAVYSPQSAFTFCVCPEALPALRALLNLQMEYKYFPVAYSALSSRRSYVPLSSGQHSFPGFSLHTTLLGSSPVRCGYRLAAEDKSLVYLVDVDWNMSSREFTSLVDFCAGADVLITAPEVACEWTPSRSGDTLRDGPLRLAAQANVKQLILSHYSPMWFDSDIAQERARLHTRVAAMPNAGFALAFAQEGWELTV